MLSLVDSTLIRLKVTIRVDVYIGCRLPSISTVLCLRASVESTGVTSLIPFYFRSLGISLESPNQVANAFLLYFI